VPAREANEVIGVSRRSDVSEPFDSSTTGATILPGVPLPQWGPPQAPEPEPAPAPEPALVAAVSAPEPPALAVSAPVPTAPLMSAPLMNPPTMAPPEPDDLVIAAPELVAEPAPVEYVAAPPAPETLAAPHAAEYVAAPPEALSAPPEALSALLAPPVTEPIDPPASLPPFEPIAAVAAVAPAFTLEAPYSHAVPTGTPLDAPDDLPASLDTLLAEPTADEGAEPDVEAKDRSPRPVVLVAIVGGVAVLAALAAFVWPGLLVTQDATTDTVAATLQVPATRTLALGTPAAIAGMTRVTGAPDAALRATATRTTPKGFGTPVGAVYGTKGTPAATVIAWTAPSSVPAQSVSAAFTGFQSAASAPVTGITTVPPGSLGGQLSCGSGVVSSTPATICFWADGSSFGAITVLRPASAERGAAVAAAVRAAVETRS
jgi:hypothetical protein